MNLEFSKLPNGIQRILLEGDLDLTGVGVVEAGFHAHCGGDSPRVLVDLSGVGFISSLGIRMVLQAIKMVSASGGRVVLLNPTTIVDSALDISGLGRFVVRGSQADACAALVQGAK